MEYTKTLSQILEHEIRSKYQNIKRFSEKSGIPYMTITSVIKRGVENTTVGTLSKICDALGISISDLYKKQALFTIGHKLTTLSREEYTNDQLLDDLIEGKIIDLYKQPLTDKQLDTLLENYRFLLSGDWI